MHNPHTESWPSSPSFVSRTPATPDSSECREGSPVGCDLLDRIVRQDSVDTFYAVDDLGDPKIHHKTRQGQGLFDSQSVNFSHQIEHFYGGLRCCLVQVRIEAKSNPTRGRIGPGHRQAEFGVQVHLHFNRVHGTGQCRPRNLAVSLDRVSVPDPEETAWQRHGKIQTTALNQLLAIHVAATRMR